jgi:NitT/TauT family transport system substrate-binding protein
MDGCIENNTGGSPVPPIPPPRSRTARRAGLTQLLIGLLGGLLLAACTPEPQTPMRVGTNVWPGYEPLYLARDLGYYPDGAVRLVEYASATEVIQAYRNRAIDAAALTLDEVLQLVQDGHRPRVVAVLDYSDGADALLATRAVRNLAGLRGKRVGVENTAVGAYLLARALQTARLPRSAIRVVPLEIQEHELAFLTGSVDAVVTFEPVRSRLLRHGARVLFDSRHIPGEILDVLVVRETVLESRAREARQLVDGWMRAVLYLRSEPHDAAARMAPRLGMNAREFLATLNGLRLPDLDENRRLLNGREPALRAPAQRLAEVMLAERLLHSPVTIDALLDARLLAETRP